MTRKYVVTVVHTLHECVAIEVFGENEVDAEATALEIAQSGNVDFEFYGDRWKIRDVVLSGKEQATE